MRPQLVEYNKLFQKKEQLVQIKKPIIQIDNQLFYFHVIGIFSIKALARDIPNPSYLLVDTKKSVFEYNLLSFIFATFPRNFTFFSNLFLFINSDKAL